MSGRGWATCVVCRRRIVRRRLGMYTLVDEMVVGYGPISALTLMESKARHPSRSGHSGPVPAESMSELELAPGAGVEFERGVAVFVCPRGHKSVHQVE